jgi:hypothetical protein
LTLGAWATGCVSAADAFRRDALPRAAFELGCPQDQLATTPLGEDRWGVQGCGKKVVYVYSDRIGWVNNSGVLPAPLPSPNDLVVVPLHVYLLSDAGDAGGDADTAALAASVPEIAAHLNGIFDPARVRFDLIGALQTLKAAGGTVPRRYSDIRKSLPANLEAVDGVRLFIVGHLDANGAGLGGVDVVVEAHPKLRPVAGSWGNPISRVTAHVLAGALGLGISSDERSLMALGTAGTGLDATEAATLHAAAKRLPGATLSRLGTLPRDFIAKIIRKHWGGIKGCYEPELHEAPAPFGTLTVAFTIAGGGRVTAASISQDDMHSAALEGCVLGEVGKWVFPEPKGGGNVYVTYPWKFSPAAPGSDPAKDSRPAEFMGETW